MKDAALQEKLKKLDLQELIDFLETLENYESDGLEKADERKVESLTADINGLDNDVDDLREKIKDLQERLEKIETWRNE